MSDGRDRFTRALVSAIACVAAAGALVLWARSPTRHVPVNLPRVPGERPLDATAAASAHQLWYDGKSIALLGPASYFGRRPVILRTNLTSAPSATTGVHRAELVGIELAAHFQEILLVLDEPVGSQDTSEPTAQSFASRAWADYDASLPVVHVFADGGIPWPDLLALERVVRGHVAHSVAFVVEQSSDSPALVQLGWDGISITEWATLHADGCKDSRGHALRPEECPDPVFRVSLISLDDEVSVDVWMVNASNPLSTRVSVALTGVCGPSTTRIEDALEALGGDLDANDITTIVMEDTIDAEERLRLRSDVGHETSSGNAIGIVAAPRNALESNLKSLASAPCERSLPEARARSRRALFESESATSTR